ncbi:sigma-70 family RNA polymerase sigma factor [bacterium]|nr:sigma-70 family RNA polymerase sigma factor [bacterium]
MGETGRNRRFTALLSPAVYESAWRYAYQLAGERAGAEDLLQDALLTALNRLATLRDDARFKPWLLAIVRNRYIDHCRRQRVRPAMAAQLPEVAAPADGDPPPVWLAQALNRLIPDYRELLVLAYIEELDADEIGQVLGLSARQTTKRVSRARVALRRVLLGDRKLHNQAARADLAPEQRS